MILKRCLLIIALLSTVFYISCGKESPSGKSRIVVGISSDIESLNPLYSFSEVEGSITELLYLSLVQHTWNEADSRIETEPMLAKNWQWNGDSTSLTINLRNDVYWSDSIQVTTGDIVFSFDAYSDKDVQSRLYGTFTSFYTNKDFSLNLDKTFEVISPFEIKINFLPGAPPNLYNIDFPLIPKHVFEKIDRKNFASASAGLNQVTDGAFNIGRWEKNQSVILNANQKSFLHKSGTIAELIFKIVPDYTSRLTQLKNGEVDFLDDIKPDDIDELKKNEGLSIIPLKGREYEYIGWNNIESKVYNENGKIIPNKLFGSANVRKALTYAVNREEILDEYLHNFGEIATGPVTPIFKGAKNSEVIPYPYNPDSAKTILAREGWTDTDNNGILEKGNNEFKFTLTVPGRNPRRAFTATRIKNNLKAVGIEVNISTLELGVFIDDMFGKKLDAWLASWFVPIPIDLKTYWFSDLTSTPLNAVSYQNSHADLVIKELSGNLNENRKDELYKIFQEIMHNDEPVSFLYWIDNITAHNKKVKNVNITPLGFIHHCWEWSLTQ